MKVRRKLNVWDIFCIATGAMISSGLFVLPALAYRYTGPSMIVAYCVAGILLIPSLLSKAELVSAMPRSGGTYFFIERSFGPILGIFGGLASWFSLSLKSAFALVGIGAFIEYFLPEVTYFQIKLVASGFCVLFVVINIVSVRLSSRIQNLLVCFLLSACVLYIFIGLPQARLANFSPFLPSGVKPFLSVVGLVFISYGGLTKIAALAEDTHAPSRTIPLGMILSLIVVQTLYFLCVAVTVGVLPSDAITATLTPITHGALHSGGVGLAIVMSLAAMTAFITTANAGILSSSRVPLAMARDELLPNRFAAVSQKHNTPYISITVTGIFMLAMILFLDLEKLVKVASTLLIMLFMFVNLSVIIMRESKLISYRPSFKASFYPWAQICALVAYTFLIVRMGHTPLILSLSFVGISVVWFLFSVRKIKRQSALMHLVERVTAKELVDTSLEEELKEILHKRDNVIKDRFDHLIEMCPILDIEEKMTRDEFFRHVAEVLSTRLATSQEEIVKLLIKREEESHTVIEKGLAIPHIIVDGEHQFEVIMVRAHEGIVFSSEEEPVHLIFVLAGSHDERNFHLRTLMAIAQVVREPYFYRRFLEARNEETLRILILSSARKRQ